MGPGGPERGRRSPDDDPRDPAPPGVRPLRAVGTLLRRRDVPGAPMPLSEHEERILAEIERQLAAEDPRFAAKSKRRRRRPGASPLGTWSRTTKLRLAVTLGVLGVLCVLGLVFSIVLGAVGLAMILVAILLGGSAVRERPAPETVPPDER
ncbi:DUF3040 domain-containing protein [Nitriliruptoraceae bacterium ZYF776]|nr:DUF3040 domain-containing protein [Profundirhabdus halotolerans]